MADEKQFGVFWGTSALYFVKSEASGIKKIFQFPFGDAEKKAIKSGPLSPAGMGLSSQIKSALKENRLENSFVNLSLPAREIIFRSFVIPWIPQHEIKSVVEFEASKYIPFSLEKLVFSFHPITITEHTTRRIRIIFIAIKSDAFNSYVRFLEDASLRIASIEPGASSLIRALNSKNLIPKDQTIALLEEDDVGRIIVIDDEIPQFVREFHLSVMTPEPGENDPEALIKKITGEVRISLDYFNRQNGQLQVKQVFLISLSESKELSQAIEKTLSVPISAIDHASVLGDSPQQELGFLNAYGASILGPMDTALHFSRTTQETSMGKKIKVLLPRKPVNYKSLIKTALICIPLAIGSIIFFGTQTQKLKKNIAVLSEDLGSFQDADISFIEQSEFGLKKKFDYFKKIRMDSDAALFLLLLPDMLPQGTWVENLSLAYDDSAAFEYSDGGDAQGGRFKAAAISQTEATPTLSLTIQGYAYSENRNQQFRLVNQILRNLTENKEFSRFFSSINLETTQAKKIDEHSVTSFTIVCQQKNES